MTIDSHALGTRAEAMLAELAAISAEPDRLVRLFLSPEHRRAADLVTRWMQDGGMETSEDGLGTVTGRYRAEGEGQGGRNTARRLLVGSHLDTVIDAGKYDGMFGVVAAILAVEHFSRTGHRFPFGIDVLAFGDEEGSRFPTTLSTSMAIAGAFQRSDLAKVDRQGISFEEALRRYGKDPRAVPTASPYAPGEAAGYVELHIEQGPVLEAEDEPLGVVSAIVGQSRAKITVTGMAGHAGTTPMNLRRDPLAAASEIMIALERIALDTAAGDGTVATVGRLDLEPGAVNVIPGVVRFTIDVRSVHDEVRRAAVERFYAEARRIGEQRGCAVTIEPFHAVDTTHCDPGIRDGLDAAISGLGGRPISLPSGAGHDGQAIAGICPIGMLFVRCRAGISHNPAEFASIPDMGLAIAALIRFIERFQPHDT